MEHNLTAVSSTTLASTRTGLSVEAIKASFLENLAYVQGKFVPMASLRDYYMALAYTIRDRLMEHWTKTVKTYFQQASRTVCYFSAEFLVGPQLGNNLINLNIYAQVETAMRELGLDLDELLEQEVEPGLGNGGLGRLAACYMDSLATLNIPAIGYGIRYEFGIFNQSIKDGWQVENTDKWLLHGNPWEIARPEVVFEVGFGGTTQFRRNSSGAVSVEWLPEERVRSLPYDLPVIGYRSYTANFIRLWKAEAREAFDLESFNTGDYYGAVQNKVSSENITKVLYPNDEPLVGKKLRLKQQYFFVSSSLQDMIRIYKQRGNFLGYFNQKYAIQLNDTHPAIGVAELMRLLVDDNMVPWQEAWEVTTRSFCYTNHTLLPEALEKWPVPIFAAILPRHLEIIYEINQRFLQSLSQQLWRDLDRIKALSIIDESDQKYVRMANLACVGSCAINGVSGLHSKLLTQQVLKEFYELWPQKFSNKTNGVTPRRFLGLINPKLYNLISSLIGDGWLKDFDRLKELVPYANDAAVRENWLKVKLENKRRLSNYLARNYQIELDPNSMFDIHAKRIHEYKRQLLNLMHVVYLYRRIKSGQYSSINPRSVIFSGKAAPGYRKAKLIIKLINDVAKTINGDVAIEGRLKVFFIPNYNVKTSHMIYPAADLSEQISTAGKEASGTGNMKFSINGALTMGTLDGANVEILEEVGKENFFLFGLDADEVTQLQRHGYHPQDYIRRDEDLQGVIEMLDSNIFNQDRELFKGLIEELVNHDEFMLCADFRSYVNAQNHANELYGDLHQWSKLSILNTAHMGKFSSDRAIMEYCKDLWHIQPVKIEG